MHYSVLILSRLPVPGSMLPCLLNTGGFAKQGGQYHLHCLDSPVDFYYFA